MCGNFWAGESFTDLADAQARVEVWCAQRAGMRIHGTTAARPVEMFNELEASCLLPIPEPYDVPAFTRVRVHRDFHLEVARALYSLPQRWIGQHLDARADSELVKLYARGQLVKTPPEAASREPVDGPGRPACRAGRIRDARPRRADRGVCRAWGVRRDLCRAQIWVPLDEDRHVGPSYQLC